MAHTSDWHEVQRAAIAAARCRAAAAPPNGAARAIITAFVTWLGDHDYSITRQFNDGSASFPDLDDIIDSFLPPTTEGTPT